MAGWIKLWSEHDGEPLILFVEISVRNTHVCTHAYEKKQMSTTSSQKHEQIAQQWGNYK